jgi:polyisoprenoid-binding protein YceI
MSTQFEGRFDGLVPGTYQIDPSHSEVGFTVRHLVGKVRGQFRTFEGTLEIAEQPFDSIAKAEIDLSSVDTRNNDRDNHLRSGDFFSVDTHPTMTFVSTGIYDKGDTIVFSGDLTIKDVTKPLDLELEYNGTGSDPWGGTRVAFEATATISRKEWGVDFNLPAAGELVVIGDKVNIVLAVEAVLQQDATAE